MKAIYQDHQFLIDIDMFSHTWHDVVLAIQEHLIITHPLSLPIGYIEMYWTRKTINKKKPNIIGFNLRLQQVVGVYRDSDFLVVHDFMSSCPVHYQIQVAIKADLLKLTWPLWSSDEKCPLNNELIGGSYDYVNRTGKEINFDPSCINFPHYIFALKTINRKTGKPMFHWYNTKQFIRWHGSSRLLPQELKNQAALIYWLQEHDKKTPLVFPIIDLANNKIDTSYQALIY